MHFSFGFLVPMLTPILLGLGVAVGNWIHGKIKNPTDAERAATLESIAEGAAALVISLTPKASWQDLLKAVIQAIESAAGAPTKNADAIQRAAAAALAKLGKSNT